MTRALRADRSFCGLAAIACFDRRGQEIIASYQSYKGKRRHRRAIFAQVVILFPASGGNSLVQLRCVSLSREKAIKLKQFIKKNGMNQ